MPGTSGERAFGAPAGCIRTELHPPPFMGSRRFRTSGRVFLPPLVGTTGRSVPPRSSRRNAPRGPNSSRSRNLRFTPIPRGAVLSCYSRGRRGGFAAPAAVAPGLCCGPRYAATWRANAHQLTTPRGPRDEALRNSATPIGGSGRRIQIGDGKSEIRNPKFRWGTANSKFEIRNSKFLEAGWPAFLIPNSNRLGTYATFQP